MNRKQMTTTVTIFALGVLIVAAAAYAPHSSALGRIAQKTVYVAPCSGVGFPSANEPAKPAKVQYPVPGEEVIARGHSGN